MSIKDVFTVWGQDTRQRSQKALERADFEMRQRNVNEQARRAELMKMLQLEYGRLKALKSNMGKIRRDYAKEYGGKAKGHQEFVAYQNAKTNLWRVQQEYGSHQVKGYRTLKEGINKDFERTPAMTKALEGYRKKSADLLSGTSTSITDQTTLNQWITDTASQEYSALMSSIAEEEKTPKAQHLLDDVVNVIWDNWDKAVANSAWKKSDLKHSNIAEAFSGAAIPDRMTRNEWDEARKKKIKTDWSTDKANIDMPPEVGDDIDRLEVKLVGLTKKIPAESKPILAKYLEERGIGETDLTSAQDRIKETQKKLDAAQMTAYDYGAVQKRAGEILLQQESAQKMKDIPDDEVEYIQSLPEAFKYEGDESLKRHGPMGVYVDSVMKTMKGKEKKSWPDLLAGLKENSKGDEKLYKRGVSMMASRILRETRAAQGIQDDKEKAITKVMKTIKPAPTQRGMWLATEEEMEGEQEYFDKPWDEMSEAEIAEYQRKWMQKKELEGIEDPSYEHGEFDWSYSGEIPEDDFWKKKRRAIRNIKRHGPATMSSRTKPRMIEK